MPERRRRPYGQGLQATAAKRLGSFRQPFDAALGLDWVIVHKLDF